MKKTVTILAMAALCMVCGAETVNFTPGEGYTIPARLTTCAGWSGSAGFTVNTNGAGTVDWTGNYIQMNYEKGMAASFPRVETSIQFRMNQAAGYTSGLKPLIGLQMEKDAVGNSLIRDGLNDVRCYLQRTGAATFNLAFDNTTAGKPERILLPGFKQELLGIAGADDSSDLLELTLRLHRGATAQEWRADIVLKNIDTDEMVSQKSGHRFQTPAGFFSGPLYAAFNSGLSDDSGIGVANRRIESFSVSPADGAPAPVASGARVVRRPSVAMISPQICPAAGTRPAPVFRPLPFGSVVPSGWLGFMLHNDTVNGTFSCFHNSWMVQNKAFELRGNNPDKKDKYPHIWDGAAEGYWGYALMLGAAFSEDPAVHERAGAFVNAVLKSQDADGYIGILAPERRWNPNTVDSDCHKGFMLLGMLYYAQAFDRPDVTEAVERAVQCDMRHFNRNTPDLYAKQFMVMSYPLMLDMLASFTGKQEYTDYATFLYDSYSSYADTAACFADCKLANLLNTNRMFIGHGCNTTGNMAMPYIAYYASGKPEYLQAGQNAFAKFENQKSMSGSLPGNEDNMGRLSFPDIGIEYCTTSYFVENALLAAEKTGSGRYFDLAEQCLYNAGMGARMPDGSLHAYLKRDNERDLGDDYLMHRYHYSPAHEPFCCTTRMMSMLPFFAGQLLKQTESGGVAAVCYAPCTAHLNLKGIDVQIDEKTRYPFGHKIEFRVEPASPVEFDLVLRIPGWARDAAVNIPKGARIEGAGEWRTVSCVWKAGDTVTLELQADVQPVRAVNNEYSLTYGPLVFGMFITPVDHPYDAFPSGHSVSEFSNGRFRNHRYSPGRDMENWDLMFDADEGDAFGFQPVFSGAMPDNPWEAPPLMLEGPMMKMRSSQQKKMVPMGATVLRRITFQAGHMYQNDTPKEESLLMDENTSM